MKFNANTTTKAQLHVKYSSGYKSNMLAGGYLVANLNSGLHAKKRAVSNCPHLKERYFIPHSCCIAAKIIRLVSARASAFD